ncbi:NUDIX hydrolase [Clostridium subterminale]|uniref:NUDIX hydrolase n=1 Tax=Clostridium subterminale TaxID=1550 RepID=A0ABN1KKI1_CLOSU
MGWIEEIKNYIPHNEEEEKDKNVALLSISQFNNLLTRENPLIHVTSSGYIVNNRRTKVLMVHHNIYKTWCWTGGHADGDEDLLHVAIKEAKEETGVEDIRPITPEILSLDIIEVIGHYKRGKYVSAHLHLSLAYLLEADEEEEVKIKEDENSGVKWLPIDEIYKYSNEVNMIKLYEKFNDKIKSRGW